MKLFCDDEICKTKISDEELYGKAFPLVKLFRELTAEHPDQYLHLELFPMDMIKSMLDFAVYYLGLDGRKVRLFLEKYPVRELIGATADRVIAYMGEDKYNEIIEELYLLIESVK